MFAIHEVPPTDDPSGGRWLEWNPALEEYRTTASSKYATKFADRRDAEMTVAVLSLHWERPLEIREVIS